MFPVRFMWQSLLLLSGSSPVAGCSVVFPKQVCVWGCLLKDPTFNMWLRVSVLAWLWSDLQLAHLFARVFLLWALVDTAGLKHKIR